MGVGPIGLGLWGGLMPAGGVNALGRACWGQNRVTQQYLPPKTQMLRSPSGDKEMGGPELPRWGRGGGNGFCTHPHPWEPKQMSARQRSPLPQWGFGAAYATPTAVWLCVY